MPTWRATEAAQADALCKAGHTISEIALQLGRPKSSVARILRKARDHGTYEHLPRSGRPRKQEGAKYPVSNKENPRVDFVSKPEGLPVPSKNTKYWVDSIDIGNVDLAGGLLLESLYFSLDPYMRHRMETDKPETYIANYVPGQPLDTMGLARIVRSDHAAYKSFQIVQGFLPVKKYNVIPAGNVGDFAIVPSLDSYTFPLTAWIGVLGLTGLTAWIGLRLLDGLKTPKPRDKLFVSGASGAVGLVVVQLAKKKGWTVIASTSSANSRVLKALGVDHVVDRNKGLKEQLAAYAPIQAFYDNVGGQALEAFLDHADLHSVIIGSGMMPNQGTSISPHVPNLALLIDKSITYRGFIQVDYDHWKPDFFQEMIPLLNSRSIKSIEEQVNGLDQFEQGFIDKTLKSQKLGKVILKV